MHRLPSPNRGAVLAAIVVLLIPLAEAPAAIVHAALGGVSATVVEPDGVIAPGLPLNLTLPGDFNDSHTLAGNVATITLDADLRDRQARFDFAGLLDLAAPGYAAIGEAAVVFTTDVPLRYSLEAHTTGFRFTASFSNELLLQTFFDPAAPGGVGGNVPLGGFAALGVIDPGMHTIDFRLIAEPLRAETIAADLSGELRLMLTPMAPVPEPSVVLLLVLTVFGSNYRGHRGKAERSAG